MTQLTKDDLLAGREFESNRDGLQQELQAVLQKRRYILGPSLIVSFFNKDIVKYRLEQLLWAERITDDHILHQHLNSFNNLIPGPSELIAEILIKFDVKTAIQTTLEQFKNLEHSQSIFLTSDNDKNVYPEYFQNNTSGDHHCVYYIRFNLNAQQINTLNNNQLFLAVKKDSYIYQIKLAEGLI